jgi:hypothetical protein
MATEPDLLERVAAHAANDHGVAAVTRRWPQRRTGNDLIARGGHHRPALHGQAKLGEQGG